MATINSVTGVVIAALILVLAAVVLAGLRERKKRLEAEEQREELARKLEHHRTQPAVISHEIRTPIALIKGASELLAEETPGPLTPIQRQFVTTIYENSQLVTDIAQNFLADLQLQKRELHTSVVDVHAIVGDTARELRRLSDAPIIIDAVGGALDVEADEPMIRQLIWNLVNNSVRHSGNDSPVNVRVERGEGGGVHLVVSDEGKGMTESELEELFTPFSSGSTRRPGSGIGMMVSRKIAEQHGGRIYADSDEGVGTSIHVVLPARLPR